MKDSVLITGGAGFIGSRLARKLLRAGYEVSILDNFSPQIHGSRDTLPDDLTDAVRLFRGDVRDVTLCEKAMNGCQVLVHLAAETGTGQSMHEVRRYTDVNIGATAGLMEILLKQKKQLRSIVLASSRSVYGEGAALCSAHGLVYPQMRSNAEMLAGDFEPKCPTCNSSTIVTPTPEDAPFRPASLYGLTKQMQEQMILMYARVLGSNGFGLRYQNVFGPGQSLKNPYTGILAIFCNLARANKPIYIFEDGHESRDFVHVDDVVEATFLAVEAPPQQPVALNVGTGVATPVLKLVEKTVAFFSSQSEVSITAAFREGDIRHNCADIRKVKRILGFAPSRTFDEGINNFLEWAAGQGVECGNYEQALSELRQLGLMHE